MIRLRYVVLALASFFLVSGFESGERAFAPGIDEWALWEAHDPTSTNVIDHSAWGVFLNQVIREDATGGPTLVDYAQGVSQRAILDDYLAAMAALPISTYARDEQMAYWINLYNAITIKVVLEAYPVESIQDIDISPGWFSSGPWGAEVIVVEGTALTLNDIEHRILRPIMRDPRVHYAVNCASIGCPDLAPVPFTAQNLEDLMTSGAKAYVNDPRGVSIKNKEITVSKIYDWFIEDFDHTEQGILNHLKTYAEPDLLVQLEEINALSNVDYDWSLNDVK